MKILITSDIHYNLINLTKLKQKYQNIYHLDAGDSVLKDEKLKKLNINSVRGNCDYNYQLPLIKIVELDNLKILITHGHLLNVKNGLTNLVNEAIKMKVNVVIFGHTHIPFLKTIKKITLI